ncbi:hypothetical protein [Cryobacterium roopkundense]|uniref:Uncharacterized protein n=1 Tax=Cryobacterium roopkundense TaxID=1001240 RepID=A0A7W8ZVE3_9MICO|nr:hypothetical protein [Cryobacterium roopkundense]MBB5640936.1 hypothetical protein [Cryobacterium roopkundense]
MSDTNTTSTPADATARPTIELLGQSGEAAGACGCGSCGCGA